MELFSAIWGGLVSLVTEPIKGWQQRKTLAVEQEVLDKRAEARVIINELEG